MDTGPSAGIHARFANVSSRMDSERGHRINAFLIVRHVFFSYLYIHYTHIHFLYILLYIGTLLYYTYF